MHNIKRYFIIATLFLFSIYQIPAVKAMQGGDSEKTETEIAQEEENKTGRYINSQLSLLYKPKNTVKKRIEHIKRHLSDDNSKKKHTYFNPGTEVYNDIIGFISIVIDQFNKNGINVASLDKSRNIMAGEIMLHGEKYKVIDNYDGVQHTYDIIPTNLGSNSYPVVGTMGGSKGDGSPLYCYRLALSYTAAIEIETFFPC